MLSQAEARRLAIRAQALDGTTHGVLETVRRIAVLQLDPTSRVAPSHLLVLWGRLGPFDRAELDRLLWHEHSLFEWRASIRPTEDFPLVKADMIRFPGTAGAWQRRVGAWLRTNESFRGYVLRELERRGPLRSRDLEDRSVVPWPSSGWTRGRNVTQMLEFLGTRGEILVAGREGSQRLWNLPERVLPPEILASPPAPERAAAQRRLRSLGLVRPTGPFKGAGETVRVKGVRGEWVADKGGLDHLEDPLPARMTFLSPFDRLIYDRERTEDLFGFRYRTAIYTPASERTHGSYALPILVGERLVGRLDSAFDRKRRVLRVNALYPEGGARIPRTALRETLRSLGEFLGAGRIEGG